MAVAFGARLLGARELERALKQLPKAVSKSVLRSTGRKALMPVYATASATAPKGFKGRPLKVQIGSTLTKNQRQGRVKRGAVEVFVGSSDREAHLVEFGTGPGVRVVKKKGSELFGRRQPHPGTPAKPFLRPAWDSNKDAVLQIFKREIWKSLSRAARRLAKRAEAGKISARQMREIAGL